MKMNKVNHSYQSYNCAEGIANVNIYNGNLLFEYPLVSTGMNSFEISTSLVYNSDYKSTDFNGRLIGMGNGWKLNIEQHLFRYESSFNLEGFTEDDYVYIDSNWNIHKFVKYYPNDDTTYPMYYYDESGTGLRLIIENSESYIITDSNDNALQFNSSGLIVKITSSINNEIEKQITYNNFGNILSVFDIRKPYRKIKFIYDEKFLIDCYAYEEAGKKGKKGYKFEYGNNKLKKIIKYTNDEGDSKELNKKIMSFEYNVNSTIEKIINSTNLTGILFSYDNNERVSVVNEGAFTINYDLEGNEQSNYLKEGNYFADKKTNEDCYEICDYLINNSSKTTNYDYVMNDDNVINHNQYSYQEYKTLLINKEGIKLNYFFNLEEELISCLEGDNNVLYTLNNSFGCNIDLVVENNEYLINDKKTYILDNSNNYAVNISSNYFEKFNEEKTEELEYYNLSFWLLFDGTILNKNYLRYNYTIKNKENEEDLNFNDSLKVEKTSKLIWQYVTIPIKIPQGNNELDKLEIIFSIDDEQTKIYITNLKINNGNSMNIYIRNENSNTEDVLKLNYNTKLLLDDVEYRLLEDINLTESDLFNTYKSIYINEKTNKSYFEFFSNNGRKVRKVTKAEIIINNNKYELCVKDGIPNYSKKSLSYTEKKNNDENTEFIWSIAKNQISFHKDNDKLKNYCESKTQYIKINDINYTEDMLNGSNSYEMINQIYFDGTIKMYKDFYNVIEKKIYDSYGNIVKEMIYNENDVLNAIEYIYSYVDEEMYNVEQVFRELPNRIIKNGQQFNCKYDNLNQKLDSYGRTVYNVNNEYDIYKENVNKIKFFSSSNEIEYMPNDDIKTLYTKDSKFEFIYNKLSELRMVKNNDDLILILNSDKNENGKIYTITKNNLPTKNIYYDKYGKIKEYYLEDFDDPKIVYQYEEIGSSDYSKRIVKVDDKFSSDIYNISYFDDTLLPYSIEKIEGKQEIKKTGNKVEYNIGSDNNTYVYNINTIPFPNNVIISEYKSTNNEDEKIIESFSFVYENDNNNQVDIQNDKLNRVNKKTRSYKICSKCKSDMCNCGDDVEKIDNIVVERKINFKYNSMLPESIIFNVSAKFDGVNSYNELKTFSYVNDYNNGKIIQMINNGEYFTKNPYKKSNSTDYIISNNTYEYLYDSYDRIVSEIQKININFLNQNIENKIYTNEWTYEYDENTNMLSKKIINGKEIKYVYDNGMLTKIINDDIMKTVKYDEHGNISKYADYEYSYDDRGFLKICENENYGENQDTCRCNFYYDYKGCRYKKEIDKSISEIGNSYFKINYFYDGNRLIGEDWLDGKDVIKHKFRYFYDLEGITGFNYWSSDDSGYENEGYNYNYIKDSLGNINKIMYEGETIGEYIYDAWGNFEIIEYLCENEDSQKRDRDSFILNNNPFRYKGYYYDVETNLFLVTSRYYSPELGRFIQPADVSTLNPSSINGLNLYTYANNNPIGIAYNNSSAIGSTSVGGGLVSSIGAGSLFAENRNPNSTSKGGLNLGWIANKLDAGSTLHGLYSSASTIYNNISYFSKNLHAFSDDMTMLGASMKDGVLAFNQFSWGLGKSDIFGVALGVGLDIYDSVQRGVSPGGVVLGATLTAAKGVGLIYLNKGILYGATALGSAICPGVGTVVGFVVGGVVCVFVDIFVSNWLDELIDSIAK